MQELSLEKTPVLRLFFSYFIPTLLGMLSMSLVTAVDGIFVGHGVGSDGIAAIILYTPLYMIFSAFSLMLGAGCSVVASYLLAKNKVDEVRQNITQCFVFATGVSIVAMIIILGFSKEIATLLGSSEALMDQVIDYMIWLTSALIFQMYLAIGLFVIRLDGAPRLAMMCEVIMALANIVLDYIFVFPLDMGVKGAAIATAISEMIGGGIAITYMIFYAKKIRIKDVKDPFKRFWHNIFKQMRFGSSSMLGSLAVALLIYVGNSSFMALLGDLGVGAFGVVCYYTPLVFMAGNAIAQSAQPIISYNMGLGLKERVNDAMRLSVYTALIISIIGVTTFVFMPEFLVAIFLNEGDKVIPVAVDGFPLFSVCFVFLVVNIVYIGYLQSIERIKSAIVLSLLRGAIFLIPCFIFMPKLFGVTGLWLALAVTEILTSIASLLYWRFLNR